MWVYLALTLSRFKTLTALRFNDRNSHHIVQEIDIKSDSKWSLYERGNEPQTHIRPRNKKTSDNVRGLSINPQNICLKNTMLFYGVFV
ncbi:hypothetical protein AQBE111736_03750 [Aquirufa beregesia]